MAKKTSSPSMDKTAFDCPHCGAYLTQQWFCLHADIISGEKKTPAIPDEKFKAGIENNKDFDAEMKQRLTDLIGKMDSGMIFFQEREGESSNSYQVNNLYLSQCHNCDQISLWVHDNLVFPSQKAGAHPNSDLPGYVKHNFEKARSMLNHSLRGAAAFFRLGIQKLGIFLDEVWIVWKKVYGDNEKLSTTNETAPLYKKWWVWVLALIFLTLTYRMIAGKPSVYKMSPAEQLSYAKNLLELKNFRGAINHLDAIPKKSPLFAEAEMVRKEIIVKQKQQEEILKQEQAAAEEKQERENALFWVQERKAFAKTYEKELLQQGMDASVITQEEDNSVLQVRYILMNKSFVHDLSNNTEFIDTLRRMGFKKLKLTNGYDENWAVSL